VDYEGKLEFNIIPAEETAQRSDEIEEYGFTDAKHGLVIFDAAGEAAVKLPGHAFGREEIEAGLLETLGK